MTTRVYAPAISRILRRCWMSSDDYFPIVSQAGPGTLVESRSWRVLGWCADLLAKHGGYVIIVGGQWLHDSELGGYYWNGWLDVTREA